MEMYKVGYSIGSYEDYRETDVFVTYSEEIANAWKDKAEKLVDKWKVYFNSEDCTFKGGTYLNADYYFYEFNGVYIAKINVR